MMGMTMPRQAAMVCPQHFQHHDIQTSLELLIEVLSLPGYYTFLAYRRLAFVMYSMLLALFVQGACLSAESNSGGLKRIEL
jgi:hypothetical protein